MSLDVGVSNLAREGDKGWIGVNNVAREIDKMWIGDENGKAREFWSSFTKKFIHRYIGYSPNWLYVRTSEDFVNWTEFTNVGSSWYGFRNGSSVKGYSLFVNDRYYFINLGNLTFQYTHDGITYTEGVMSLPEDVMYYRSRLSYIEDDNAFYVAYSKGSSVYVYKSVDLVAWEKLATYTKNNSNDTYVDYFLKGKFQGKEQYVIFLWDYDYNSRCFLVSDDCITWTNNVNDSGYWNGYNIACKASDGIYYTKPCDTGSNTKWSLHDPNGNVISLSGDFHTVAYGSDPIDLMQSLYNKDYLVARMMSTVDDKFHIWLIPKKGGACIKVSTPECLSSVGRSRELNMQGHKMNGKATKLVYAGERKYSDHDEYYLRFAYCSSEYSWTEAEYRIGGDMQTSDIIYD